MKISFLKQGAKNTCYMHGYVFLKKYMGSKTMVPAESAEEKILRDQRFVDDRKILEGQKRIMMKRLKIGLGVLAVVAIIAAFYPRPLTVKSTGFIAPLEIWEIESGHDHKVTVVEKYPGIESNAIVREGQPLVRLESQALLAEINRLKTEVERLSSEMYTNWYTFVSDEGNVNSAEREKLVSTISGKRRELKTKEVELNQQIENLKKLDLRSPSDGIITKPKNLATLVDKNGVGKGFEGKIR